MSAENWLALAMETKCESQAMAMSVHRRASFLLVATTKILEASLKKQRRRSNF
jgi:hypothetical protein